MDQEQIVVGGHGIALAFTYSSASGWDSDSQIAAAYPYSTLDQSNFGNSVGISGRLAIVGSWATESSSGSAYFFKRSPGAYRWPQIDKVQGTTAGDGLGYGVALSGCFAVISAPWEGLYTQGAAKVYRYLFVSNSWSLNADLLSLVPDGNVHEGDEFGKAVDVSDGELGTFVVVGSPYDSDNGRHKGAAYVFRRALGTWQYDDRLEGELTADSFFGADVAVSGRSIAVCSPNTPPTSNPGTVHFFKRIGGIWRSQGEYEASDGGYLSRVCIDGDWAAAGAPEDDAVYLFQRSGGVWEEEQKLTGVSGSTFGESVVLNDGILLVGAPQLDGSVTNSGAVYVFEYQ